MADERCNYPAAIRDAFEVKDFGQDSKNHWVEKLFPPMFRFSFDELANKNSEEGSYINCQFEKLIRKISPEDIDRIQNVYHRVWMILKSQKEEPSVCQNEGPDCQELDVKDTFKETSNDNESPVPENESHNEACIWDSADIRVLRRFYKTNKEENIKLVSEISMLKEENLKLKTLERNEAKQLSLRNKEVLEAIKANKRLEILTKYLKKETDKCNKIIRELNQRRAETENANAEMSKEISVLSSSLDSERLERKMVELEFQKQLDEITTALRNKEQCLIEELEKTQTQTTQKISSIQRQLDKERELHRRTVRGLNHLRMHYGSLPVEDGEADPHQLKTWTH